MPRVRLAAAQLDLVVGDLDGNVDRMLDAYERADAAGCDLVAFPELSLTGYPPEDLLLRPSFVAHCAESLEKFAARTGRAAAVVGFPEVQRDLANAAALCANGRVQGVYRKHLLPNYAVFDEQRYFAPSTVDGPLFVVAGVRIAITICEDAWSPNGPIITQAAGGAELVVNINASPYYAGRIHERDDDARHPRRRRVGARALREPRRRPGRAGLRRRVDAVRRGRSTWSRAGGSSTKTC